MIFGAGDQIHITFISPQRGYLYIINESPPAKGQDSTSTSYSRRRPPIRVCRSFPRTDRPHSRSSVMDSSYDEESGEKLADLERR